jgi:hypothetical protein
MISYGHQAGVTGVGEIEPSRLELNDCRFARIGKQESFVLSRRWPVSRMAAFTPAKQESPSWQKSRKS